MQHRDSHFCAHALRTMLILACFENLRSNYLTQFCLLLGRDQRSSLRLAHGVHFGHLLFAASEIEQDASLSSRLGLLVSLACMGTTDLPPFCTSHTGKRSRWGLSLHMLLGRGPCSALLQRHSDACGAFWVATAPRCCPGRSRRRGATMPGPPRGVCSGVPVLNSQGRRPDPP